MCLKQQHCCSEYALDGIYEPYPLLFLILKSLPFTVNVIIWGVTIISN